MCLQKNTTVFLTTDELLYPTMTRRGQSSYALLTAYIASLIFYLAYIVLSYYYRTFGKCDRFQKKKKNRFSGSCDQKGVSSNLRTATVTV